MPSSGGAELSMYTILRHLSTIGYSVIVVTGTTDESIPFDDNGDKAITVHRIANVTFLDQVLDEILNNTPNIYAVLTQNLWCDRAILFAKRYNLPVIYFHRSPFGELDISPQGSYSCQYIIANSRATKEFLERKWGLKDIPVILPTIDFRNYVVRSNSYRFITMINPIVIKGGEIFKEIAKQMPDREFLAVTGWHHLRSGQTWNINKLKDLAAGFNADLLIPEEVNLDDLPNVIIHPTVGNMRLIYSQTRLLLIPSIIPEASPRVAYEAMINGIPVIGSDIGGIGEVVGLGGEILEDFRNIDAWLAAINRFDNNEYFELKSMQAREKVKHFDYIEQVQPLLEILTHL